MSEWLFHLPVVWMTFVGLAAAYLITWAMHALLMALAAGIGSVRSKASRRESSHHWASFTPFWWHFWRRRSGPTSNGPTRQ
jgi:hypothetical protein